MLDKQTQEKLFKLSEELQGLMEYLYVRWQDEKDFEDIKDYSEPIKHILQKHEATFGKELLQ